MLRRSFTLDDGNGPSTSAEVSESSTIGVGERDYKGESDEEERKIRDSDRSNGSSSSSSFDWNKNGKWIGIVLIVIMILGFVFISSGNQLNVNEEEWNEDNPQRTRVSSPPKTKYAWVSFLYGSTYYWPLRVMQNSLRMQGTKYDIVTLVDSNVPEELRNSLIMDGTRVMDIPKPIQNRYQDERIFQSRFGPVMSKLNMFNMTEYEKIVYLDADTMVLENSDILFQCGDFCAVFINPCIFNSGVMVIKPSDKLFSEMISKLPYLPSYDGADQGFLNSYFSDLLSAPLWKPPKEGEVSKPITGNYRLPTNFHVDHFLFYQRGKWDMPCLTPSILEFMGPSFLKPWNWWTYSVMDLSYDWLHSKQSLSGSYDIFSLVFYLSVTTIIAFCIRLFQNSGLRYFTARFLQKKRMSDGVQVMQCLCAGFIILALFVFFAFSMIDPSTHPSHAFFVFFLWMHGMVPFGYYTWLLCYIAPCQPSGVHQKNVSTDMFSKTILLSVVPFAILLLTVFAYKVLGLVFLFHKIAFLIFGALTQIFSFFFFFGLTASIWIQAYSNPGIKW
eukprot:TRINITY_DN4227_c0_g1_i1.p1 TRINITY_DN4227_c0_g1~~TRINITY_DN4227_c0_g1_i1.p1  ORF type:complete len:557 (+),score=165.54 TRINITY_DN4227_c0_g1_i1:192-1862(+)